MLDRLKNKKIIYEIVSGSTCYNLNTPASDIDIRGVYLDSQNDFIWNKSKQISDEKSDICYYEFSNFIHLLGNASPELIELLYTPKKHVKTCHPLFQQIINNRDLFMTQRLHHSFAGYAFTQISKAKGLNKAWHLEKKFGDMLKPPTLEDYIYFFKDEVNKGKPISFKKWRKTNDCSGNNLLAAGMEHTNNVYRIYETDCPATVPKRNFFIKKNTIACSSISKEIEKNLRGFVLINWNSFKEDVEGFKRYNKWRKNRNPERWRTQLSGEVDFDLKNMLHSVRLLLSGINIFENGEPIIEWSGKEREFLMGIREGKYSYDYLIKKCEELNEKLKGIDKTNLPFSSNAEKTEELKKSIYNQYWKNN